MTHPDNRAVWQMFMVFVIVWTVCLSRREATTKLFFGFPHDPRESLRFWVATRLSLQSELTTSFRDRPSATSFDSSSTSGFSAKTLTDVFTSYCPASVLQVCCDFVRTWFAWTCSSDHLAVPLASRTTLQACASMPAHQPCGLCSKLFFQLTEMAWCHRKFLHSLRHLLAKLPSVCSEAAWMCNHAMQRRYLTSTLNECGGYKWGSHVRRTGIR